MLIVWKFPKGIAGIGVARRAKRTMPPKCLENIGIFCFERRFSEQNSVIPLKSYSLASPVFLPPHTFLDWLRHWSWAAQNGHMRTACLRPLVYMVVKLNAHGNKHLLNVKFSYMEHCWWVTFSFTNLCKHIDKWNKR